MSDPLPLQIHLRSAVQLIAVLLALAAAFFLARGTVLLSAEQIADLSKTRFGENRDVARSLTREQANTWAGTGLLFLSIVAQGALLLWPVSWAGLGRPGWRAGLIGLGAFLVVVAVAWTWAERSAWERYQRVEAVLDAGKSEE